MIFFYFLIFSALPILFWLEKKLWWYFLIFSIFMLFLLNENYGMGRNTSERFFLFSLFFGLSQRILAWKEAMMVFSTFLNFFAIFFKFSITGPVGTHRNDFFYFLFFSALPILFWHEMKLWWSFLFFWIFLLFFSNFLLRVG